MPVDLEQNKLDFYGRIFYRTKGWDVRSDEFFFELWEENWHSEDTLRYGPPAITGESGPPASVLPHLVSSHLRGIPVKGARRDKRVFTATTPSQRDLHAPALDLDFRVIQIEHKMPQATQPSVQSVMFDAPARMNKRELDILQSVMTKELHLCDAVDLRNEPTLKGAKLAIAMHFHPANRVHVVPSTKNYHLYINRAMPWDDYEYMLQALADCKLLNPGFTDFSIYRHQSFLRYPGVTKVDLPGPDSETSRRNKDVQEAMSLTYKAPPRIPLPTREHESEPVYVGGNDDPF